MQATVGFATGEALVAGQEIYNNYGPKSNEELLLSYGFVLQGNPQDAYQLEVAGLAAEDEEELHAKHALLAALALPKRHGLRAPAKKRLSKKRDRTAVASSLQGCLPAGLLRVLRLAILNRAELMALHGRNEPPELALAAPVSGRNEMAALRQLLELLRGKLLRLDAGTEEAAGGEGGDLDERVTAAGSGSGEIREACKSAAVVYLGRQRDLLQFGIAECKSRLYAVAAATTRLRSSREWRVWDYAPAALRRRVKHGFGVRVIELPARAAAGEDSHHGHPAAVS